jgi:D-alanyl-D-alanine-carboxypeptidase/D-alanyl-D-alanine-endopeptidase
MARARHSQALALLALIACACHAAPVDPPETLEALVAQEAGGLVENRVVVGAAAGVITPASEGTWYFGRTRKGDGPAPDADTLFEIGSVTKTFTGILLAAMQLAGEAAATDPLQACLPEGVTAPKYGDREITLRELATHASGLPRMPDNFGRDADPYARYTSKKLYDFLNAHELRRAPGVEFEYSNLAVGLLGHALARRAGKDYESLVIERICQPLGMGETVLHTRESRVARVAQGHSLSLDLPGVKRFTEKAPWTWDVLGPCGGLRSTLPDMMKFLAAAMGRESPLKEAMALSQQPLFPFAENTSTALCWHVSRDPGARRTLIWHNGETGGYHAFLGFYQETGTGVVILSNTATDKVDAAAVRILKGIEKLPGGA